MIDRYSGRCTDPSDDHRRPFPHGFTRRPAAGRLIPRRARKASSGTRATGTPNTAPTRPVLAMEATHPAEPMEAMHPAAPRYPQACATKAAPARTFRAMDAYRLRQLAIVGLPPLLLAGIGLAHPMILSNDSAELWRNIHLLLLPLFPLLALGPWVVAGHLRLGPRKVVAVLVYIYAAAYTALDVLAGVGAGALQADGRADATETMFRVGNGVTEVGVWAYLLAALIVVVGAARRRLATLPGGLLVLVGAFLFLTNHIYWPRGVLSMLAIGLGWVVVVLTMPASAPAARPDALTPVGATG